MEDLMQLELVMHVQEIVSMSDLIDAKLIIDVRVGKLHFVEVRQEMRFSERDSLWRKSERKNK